MSELVTPDLPAYRHRPPIEWVELVDLASSQLASTDQTLTPGIVDTVWAAAGELSNESVDDARYHALGVVKRGLARSLQEPGKRADVVEWASRNLADSWRVYSRNPRELTLEDISSFSMHHPFVPLAQESVNELPLSEHLVADTLTVVARRRSVSLAHPILGVRLVADEVRDEILKGESTAENVARNAVAGASNVLQTVLKKKREAAGYTADADDNEEPPSIREVMDGAPVNTLDWLHVAVVSATLRRDEFMADLGSYISFDEQGRAVFDRKLLVRPAMLETPSDEVGLLHTRRLKCPALSVDGLMSAVVGIVDDSVTEAQRRVEAEVKSWRMGW